MRLGELGAIGETSQNPRDTRQAGLQQISPLTANIIVRDKRA
ncbi:hypothetical protein SAMN04489740_4065 [Arthrobacter alpinus]|uniref:Uncharacterized protein n=1 Tax=Arthrobacter alpinus TaxID=656366 RepID=A0A1H5PBI1_9MICC|nr:hypothetical protein SAMN04489740_4065 [Arthrobacter alpinus]